MWYLVMNAQRRTVSKKTLEAEWMFETKRPQGVECDVDVDVNVVVKKVEGGENVNTLAAKPDICCPEDSGFTNTSQERHKRTNQLFKDPHGDHPLHPRRQYLNTFL